MPTNDDLLFAEYAVRGGLVTQAEVDESLSVQARMLEMGVRESLANVLVKRGVLREVDSALVARRAGLKSGREPIPGYTLEQRVGTGAMGSVYRAYQKGMKRHVAVKILRRDLTDDPRQVERLQREAALVGKLSHPNIVRGLDSGESSGLIWFVMEFVDGETLQERLKTATCLPVEEAISITRQMAEALEHAHSHGVVHRDVKPGNILITKDGMPRLSDYGLAKGETDDALTHVDATLGTPQYVAPEQAKNPRDADIRSDIYSLGATLYTMLAGRPPFTGESLTQILTRVLYERPTPLAELVPDVPEQVVYLVERMMARDREHRYSTPAELLRDLRAFEAGRLSVPKGFRGDMAEFVVTRRQRRNVLRYSIGFVVMVACVVFAQLYQQRQDSDRRAAAAESRFEQIPRLAGESADWHDETVPLMINAWRGFLEIHGDSPRASAAETALARWTRQDNALRQVQELQKQVYSEDGARLDWRRLVTAHRTLRTTLTRQEDAGIALERLDRTLEDLVRRRDADAQELLENAEDEVTGIALEKAAGVFDDLARRLRERYYGSERCEFVAEADALAEEFRDAREDLDEHYRPYEQELAVQLASKAPAFRNLRVRLGACRSAAADDVDLGARLRALPPRETRGAEILRRHDAEFAALAAACGEAWNELEIQVQGKLDVRRYGAARGLLEQFLVRAIPQELAKQVQQRVEQVDFEQIAAQRTLRTLAEQTQQQFVDALSAAAYERARQTLDALAERAAPYPEDNAGANAVVADGRLLLDVIERHAWSPMREHLRRGLPLDKGIVIAPARGESGPRQNYPRVHLVTLTGPDTFDLLLRPDAEPEVHPLHDLHLDTLLEYTALGTDETAASLAHAALLLTRYPPQTSAPKKARLHLAEASRLLERAGRDPALASTSARLGKLLATYEHRTDQDADLAEKDAHWKHFEALDDMRAGRFLAAAEKLNDLVRGNRRLRRTKYVLERVDELKRARDEARKSARTMGYAKYFRGARVSPDGKGHGEIAFDFEDPAAQESFTLEPGVTGVESRPLLPSIMPSISPEGAGSGLRYDHALTWRKWDGEAETHPSLFPVLVDCPFEPRRRIEVSFLYRSDAPYFFMVSIGGVNAGILSAEDDREGGRGVAVWTSGDLARPDRAFDKKQRSNYIEKHPDVVDDKGAADRYFRFEAGRVYRIRFVKEEYRAVLYVDGRAVASNKPKSAAPELIHKVAFVSYTSGEVDDLRISGILDEAWLKKQ